MEIKKLSRFAVETSLNCERCFVLQYKYKISMPMLPFTLNIACDKCCYLKKRWQLSKKLSQEVSV